MTSTEIYALIKAGIKGIGRLLLSALQGLAGLASVALFGLLTLAYHYPKRAGLVVAVIALVVFIICARAEATGLFTITEYAK